MCKRFKTGAMSYGSISKEAHGVGTAMNRIGGQEQHRRRRRTQPATSSGGRRTAPSSRWRRAARRDQQYLVNAGVADQDGAGPSPASGQIARSQVYPWIAPVHTRRQRGADFAATRISGIFHRGSGRADPISERQPPSISIG
ncbi:MAG: glutamate synthase-related protein [Caldilineaceae bacterium]